MGEDRTATGIKHGHRWEGNLHVPSKALLGRTSESSNGVEVHRETLAVRVTATPRAQRVLLLDPHQRNGGIAGRSSGNLRAENRDAKSTFKAADETEATLVLLVRTGGPFVGHVDEASALEAEQSTVAGCVGKFALEDAADGTCFTNECWHIKQGRGKVQAGIVAEACSKGRSHADALWMVDSAACDGMLARLEGKAGAAESTGQNLGGINADGAFTTCAICRPVPCAIGPRRHRQTAPPCSQKE